MTVKQLFQTEYPIFLAPMAGVTDRVYRRICRYYGSSAAYTPMISAKSAAYGHEATSELMQCDPEEPNLCLQLFGHEPDVLERAVEQIDLGPFAWIDLNMGCPTPKVTKQGDGCALMRTPALAQEMVRTLKRAAGKPVSVKFRSGWDADACNAETFAALMQDAGADMICVHPRTAVQMYRGEADADLFGKIVRVVDIPVIASGDMKDEAHVRRAFDAGCRGVMIARGSYGDPWIFSRLPAQLRGEEHAEPSDMERMAVAIAHASMLTRELPERVAMLQMRKHIAWYIHGYRNAADLRARIYETTTFQELKHAICRFAEEILSVDENELEESALIMEKSVLRRANLDI